MERNSREVWIICYTLVKVDFKIQSDKSFHATISILWIQGLHLWRSSEVYLQEGEESSWTSRWNYFNVKIINSYYSQEWFYY